MGVWKQCQCGAEQNLLDMRSITAIGSGALRWRIDCDFCGAHSPWADSKEFAIASWNNLPDRRKDMVKGLPVDTAGWVKIEHVPHDKMIDLWGWSKNPLDISGDRIYPTRIARTNASRWRENEDFRPTHWRPEPSPPTDIIAEDEAVVALKWIREYLAGENVDLTAISEKADEVLSRI